jgi:hypothetical protein
METTIPNNTVSHFIEFSIKGSFFFFLWDGKRKFMEWRCTKRDYWDLAVMMV